MQYRSVVVAGMLCAGRMAHAIPYSDLFADNASPISGDDSSNALLVGTTATADEINANLFQDPLDDINLGSSTFSLGGDLNDDELLGNSPPDDLFLAADQSSSSCGYVSRHRKREESANADETFLGNIYAMRAKNACCYCMFLTMADY